MTQVISLFSDQEKAERAVNALTNAHKEDVEVHVLEEWSADYDAVPKVIPTPGASPSSAPGKGVPVTQVVPNLKFEGGVRDFFERNLKEGGVVVIAEVADDDKLSEVRHIFEAEGGKVVSE